MSQISFACVSRGPIVLAHYLAVSGDFEDQCLEVRQNMLPNENTKIVEKPSTRIFIQRESASDLYFICAGTPQLDSKQALAFLDNLQKKFIIQFSRESKTASALALQQDFGDQIKEMIKQSNTSKIQMIEANIGDAQHNLNEALQQAMLRGDTLESMNEKADTMALNAHEYDRSAVRLRRRMCWQKYKWYLFTILAIIVLLVIILLSICGTDLSECSSSNSQTQQDPTDPQ